MGLVGLAGLVLAMSVTAPAFALWPFEQAQRLLSQADTDTRKRPAPPPADTMARECEPIRLKIVSLNRHKGLVHFMLRPRIAFLKARYKRCGDRFREQEYEYLKHATIEIPSPLPPLNAVSASTKEAKR